MLLTIRTTHRPATDLGYLLHKNPARVQVFEVSAGKARVFYPEVSEDACTAALQVDIDPIALVRGRHGAREGGLLDQYVNDRPYAANSFLATAIAQVYGSALNGQSGERAELAATPIPLCAAIAALPGRSGAAQIERLFAPLGYTVAATPQPLDPERPDWGASPYYNVTISGVVRLQDRQGRDRQVAHARRRLARGPSGPRAHRGSIPPSTAASGAGGAGTAERRRNHGS